MSYGQTTLMFQSINQTGQYYGFNELYGEEGFDCTNPQLVFNPAINVFFVVFEYDGEGM
jgi:hypothetical protein